MQTAHSHGAVKSLRDLPRHALNDVQEFFVDYNRLDGKKFQPLRVLGPDRAEKLVKKGMAAFKKQRKD